MTDRVKGGIVVKSIAKGRAVIAITCILAMAITGTALATSTENNSGDPTNIPPGSDTPEPTPVILNAIVVTLAAVFSIMLT